jgi:hypothetical protein
MRALLGAATPTPKLYRGKDWCSVGMGLMPSGPLSYCPEDLARVGEAEQEGVRGDIETRE